MNATTLIGRKAICHNCEEEMTITVEMLRNTNITHIGCGRARFMPNLNVEDVLAKVKENL